MKIFFLVVLFGVVTAKASNTNMKVGPVGTCGAEMMVLNSWKPVEKAKLKSPACFEAAIVNEASVSVLASSGATQTCGEFLKSMDDSRKKKNLLTPEKQKMSEMQIKNAKADDGAFGDYEISEPKMKFVVKQKSYCLKKGKEIRVILATYQKNKGAQYEPLFAEIFTTFKFL